MRIVFHLFEQEEGASEPREFQKATIAFNTAIEMWKLASEQIYHRFAAMLTGNSIILAVIGLVITDRVHIDSWFIYILIAAGIALCLVWIYFMSHGVRVENRYRQIAERLQRNVIPQNENVLITTDDPKAGGFLEAVTLVVYIFVIIYVAVLACWNLGVIKP
ncbi:hypothetical protein [Dehalogenimonas sp. 4OHTPN]|uniref:Small integral membrane protein n=1 Tax=Dehalogenimonas sp. 4OHTPN TaxID=3166643 RepID=A0AAU8GCF7_9CHLR